MLTPLFPVFSVWYPKGVGPLFAFAVLLAASPEPQAAQSATKLFDIPAGEAIEMLKRVANEAGLEIMYSADTVRGVRTQEVRGEFTVHDALNLMVANTVLKIVRDDKTGALAVTRAPPSRSTTSTSLSTPETPKQEESYRSMKRNNPIALIIGWLGLALTPSHNVNAAESSPPAQLSSTLASVSGVVTNSATGRTLEGARVVLQGTGRETRTDKDGVYRFFDVPAGRVNISISYTGLDTQDVPIDVAIGAANRRDVGLTAGIYTLGKFVVSGEREGNALAITIQRESTGVKHVVSTDAFGSLGANPADLLLRLPNVQGETDGSAIRYISIRGMHHTLNSITMDGNRIANGASAGSSREFQFTQVGADTIGRIEVIKSPTPDMDADSIGGAVNLVSKSAFDQKGRMLSGQLGGIMRLRSGARGQTNPTRAYAFSYSEVFGDRIGIAVNYGNRSHYSPTPVTGRNFENKVADPAYTYYFFTEDYYHKQTRWGGGVKLDYKLSDSTRFYVNLTRNRMIEPSLNHYIYYATGQTVATRDASGNLTGTGAILPEYTNTVTEWRPLPASNIAAYSDHVYKDVDGNQMEVGAVHKYATWDLDYNLYRSNSTTNYPGNDTILITGNGFGMRIEDTSDRLFPNVTQTAGPSITDPNSYIARRDLRVAQGEDAFVGAALNFKKRFATEVPSWIKAGVRVRQQDRDLFANQFRWSYVGPDGVAGVNPTNGINDDNLAQFMEPNVIRWAGLEKYPQIPVLRFSAGDWNPDPKNYPQGHNLTAALRNTPSHFVEDVALRTRSSLLNRMDFTETINAAYVMGNVEIGRLQISGGVRVEETKTEGEAAKNEITPAEAALRAAWTGPVTEAETIRRETAQYGGRQQASGEYREVFPGLHLKYGLTDSVVIRASYATNIGRPSIGQLIPNTTVNHVSRTLSISNPSLKPQFADNFDLGSEYYFEPVGMFSAGVFLKEIKQFIFSRAGALIEDAGGPYGEYVGYTFSTRYNGGYAKVRGFELSYQQQMTFLPGIFQGFGVHANYARNETEGDYGGAAPTTKVAGFTPETFNAGISYIRSPLTIRVQYNFTGERLVGVSASQARLRYRRATGIFDVKSVYEINRNLSLYLDIWNLFDENELAQEWEGGRPGRTFRTGPQMLGGLNWRY